MVDKHAEEGEKGKEDEEDEKDEEEEKGEKKKEEPVPLKWVLKYYIFVNQAFCEVSLQYQYLYDSKIFQEAKEWQAEGYVWGFWKASVLAIRYL